MVALRVNLRRGVWGDEVDLIVGSGRELDVGYSKCVCGNSDAFDEEIGEGRLGGHVHEVDIHS